jgi:Zinc-finger associated domain (zf-AD)
MLKYKLCRICMKQKKANTGFVKIFESTKMGDLVANILIDFANVSVEQNDGLPHIICTYCFENLIKCREFQKLVVQNDNTLASLAEKTPDEIEKTIAEPLVRIEKVKKCEKSTIVQLMDTTTTVEEYVTTKQYDESSSSEDEDDFIEEEVIDLPVEAVEPRLFCCCCPLQFNEEHEIIEHIKTEHAAIRNKVHIAPIDKDPEELNQCEMCFKYFVGMEKLVDHQAQYQNCKQCVECGGFYKHKG